MTQPAKSRKILVTVKSVPDASSRFAIDTTGKSYDPAGLVFHVNEYDLFAMEEAVRIRERLGSVEITALTVGPPPAEDQLRKAMGLGADRGVLIHYSNGPAIDAFSTASIIAAWARDKNFDLILCGVMSEDIQRCQTGPMLAQFLGLPCATTVMSMEIDQEWKKLTCHRELEGGAREGVEMDLPALVTVQSGINMPRYASLSNVLRVKAMSIPRIEAADLAAAAPAEAVERAFIPERAPQCEMIEGTLEEAARALLEKIRARVPVL